MVKKERINMKKVITVEGMSCAHCVEVVKDALTMIKAVQNVDVDLAKQQIIIEGTELNDSEIKTVIEEQGYTVR